MVRGLRRDRDDVVRYFERNPASAVVTPANPKLDNILSANSYQKGGWFLHMLRRQVGDEAFWKGVSTYYARYQNGNALTDDFRRVMEEVSGRPLEAFFRQWVYTPGQPSIAGSWIVRGRRADGGHSTDAGDGHRLPDGARHRHRRWTGRRRRSVETVPLDQRAQTFTFQLDKEPIDVVLDPNTWLLATFGAVERQRK